MKTKLETAKTKELLRDIKSHERSLKKHPEDDALHYAKAEDLVKLGKETGDQLRYNEALVSYNRAIELSPQNQTYFVDRSKLYIILGRPDLAAADILEAQKSPSTGDKVLDNYAMNTTKDVLKLSQVQGEIKRLITNGKIPLELEGVFSGMVQVISGISARVSEHDDTLKTHESRLDTQAMELAEIKEKAAKLESQYGQYEEATRIINFMSNQIQELQDKVKQHNVRLEKHDESIKEITEQMTKLCSKEEFTTLASRFDQVESEQVLFGGKIKVMEGRLNSQETSIATIDETLKQSNCFNKQTIKGGFAALKNEAPNEMLYHYANNFYWSLSNYLLAYRAIASGAVAGVRDKNQLEKIWNKVGSAIITATDAIPVVGGMLSLVEEGIVYINDAYKDMKFERKVAKINELMTGFMLEEDLNLALASASIQVARMKKNEIIEQYRQKHSEQKDEQKTAGLRQNQTAIDKKIETFNTKIDGMLAKITKIKTSEDTVGKTMAVKDVILFINHIATNEVVLISNPDDAPSLDKIIASTFTDNITNTNQAIQQAVSAGMTPANQGKCVVSMLNEIIYDNQLLNHPKLFKEATIHFGMNKALDLSELLDNALLTEVIGSNNQELILAGMMSLD